MKRGRLYFHNRSFYPDEEVHQLVEFGLAEIDLPKSALFALVQNTKVSKRREHGIPAYSGTHWAYRDQGIPSGLYDRYIGRKKVDHLIVIRLGVPECFPMEPFTRNGHTFDYRSWQEALVGVTAHEGMHAQHHHDRAYREKSGVRRPVRYTSPVTGRTQTRQRGTVVRVGAERIEPKCEAFELYTLRRYREWKSPQGFATVGRVCGDNGEG